MSTGSVSLLDRHDRVAEGFALLCVLAHPLMCVVYYMCTVVCCACLQGYVYCNVYSGLYY